jgi:GNAT superfamily N-acetyltransferase
MSNTGLLTVLIRDSNPTEADAIEQLRLAAWRSGFRGILPDHFLAAARGDPNGRRQLIESRQRDDGVDLVCVVDGEIVGWVSGGPTRDVDLDARAIRELYACYVQPPHWGRGLARGLLNAALEALEREQIIATTGWVLSANARMLKVMSGFGFEPDGGVRTFDAGVPVPLVRIRRPRLR